eukprot:COSAG05_NODE_1099_length_5888_cov_9.758335_7_plen_69_part_00
MTGMDEQEFTEAESNMNDLVSEYQPYGDAQCLGPYDGNDSKCACVPPRAAAERAAATRAAELVRVYLA